MSGPPQSRYVTEGTFSPAQTHILLAFIAAPERFIGPVLLSGMLDIFLMGMVLTQTWTYYVNYPQDSRRFRILVLLLFLVSLAQSSAIYGLFFRMFSIDFGKWDKAISSIGTMYSIVLILETLAGALSQLFFLERATTLVRLQFPRRRRTAAGILIGVCAPLIFAGLALGFACSVVSPNAGKLAASSGGATTASAAIANAVATDGATKLLKTMTTSWKSVTVVVDVSLTATIVTCLTLARHQNPRHSTSSLLRSLIRGIIEAQTLPLLASLSFLIGSVIDSPGTFPAIASNLEGKLATLSVLHVLNSRAGLRDRPFVQSSGNLKDFSLARTAEGDGGQHGWRSQEGAEMEQKATTSGGTGRTTETARGVGRFDVQVVERGAGGTGMSRKDGLSLEGSLKEGTDEDGGSNAEKG